MDDVKQEKATRPRSASRQRTNIKPIRFLDSELAAIEQKAKAAGLSFGAYMRACALGEAGPRAQRSPTLDHELTARAIAELNKAGSNLNQIAHAINRKDWPGNSSIVLAITAVNNAAVKILQAFEYKAYDRQR